MDRGKCNLTRESKLPTKKELLLKSKARLTKTTESLSLTALAYYCSVGGSGYFHRGVLV